MKDYTTISLHEIDKATGLVTGIKETRLYYCNYREFEDMPTSAQTTEAYSQHFEYWQLIKSKLTVITVCHNQLRHTKNLINSLRRFTINPLQIIVVNNNSTDGTQEWLSEQQGICVLNESENLGWVGAINKALDYVDTDSDFIIFANNDTMVSEAGWERKLLAHFDQTVGAVGPTSNYVAGRQSRIFDHPGITEEETHYLIGFFMCVKRDVIKEVGLLDDLHSFEKDGSKPSGGDDLDYSIRIRNLGYRLIIARDVFVFHAGMQSNKEKLTDQEYQTLCSDANDAFIAKHGQEAWRDLINIPTKVLCAVPMRSDFLHRKFAFTFSTMIKPFYFDCADIPRAHVESARNAAVRFAKERDFTHILFLDDDHIIPPDTFTRLHSIDAPVAAALAFQRVPPYKPVVGEFGLMEGGMIGVNLKPEWIRTGVRKVDAVGFSAVLIRLEVFETLSEKKLDWFKWNSMGEDFHFCLMCRDAGIDIYCDTDLVMPHIGQNLEVDEETYYSFNKESAAR